MDEAPERIDGEVEIGRDEPIRQLAFGQKHCRPRALLLVRRGPSPWQPFFLGFPFASPSC